MIPLTKKNITIGVAIIFVVLIVLLFGVVTLIWMLKGDDDSEFQDLVDLANSKL